MHSALSVKAKTFAFFGIFAVWATIAFAQIPEQDEEQTNQSDVIIQQEEEKPVSAPAVVPRAPLLEQRNTLCDTSYSEIVNCGNEEGEEQSPNAAVPFTLR